MLTDFENSAMWACLFVAALGVYFGYSLAIERLSSPGKAIALFVLAAVMILLAWWAPW
jgi:FtsH-binding integral membrane protein